MSNLGFCELGLKARQKKRSRRIGGREKDERCSERNK